MEAYLDPYGVGYIITVVKVPVTKLYLIVGEVFYRVNHMCAKQKTCNNHHREQWYRQLSTGRQAA